VVVVSATIAWQAQAEQRTSSHSESGVLVSPLLEHRAAQVREQNRSMPNRFALSKAYYGDGDAMLEAAELERQAEAKGTRSSSLTKS